MQKGKVSMMWLIVLVLFAATANATTAPLTHENITLRNGKTDRFVCKQSAGKTLVYIKHKDIPDSKYAFVITNKQNIILGYSEDNTLDFSNVPANYYRVWGVAYRGWKKRPTGISIKKADLSSKDFKISKNYINIHFSTLSAPSIQTEKKREYFKITERDQQTVHFKRTDKNKKSDFTFVVTNYRGRVVGLTDKSFDFSGFDSGKFYVYGLTYTGDLTIQPGDFMMGEVTDGCFAKSEKYVVVEKDIPLIEELEPLLEEVEAPEPVFASTDANMNYASNNLSAELIQTIDQKAIEKEAKMISRLEESLIKQCSRYAGIVLPDNNQAFINDDIITISATTTEKPNLGQKGSIKYLLVAENTQAIQGISNTPSFAIAISGTYHIYPFVANFSDTKAVDFFDEKSIQLGTTSIEKLKNTISESGICADIASQGATIIISSAKRSCLADAGTMQMPAKEIELVSGDINVVEANQIDAPVIPKGYEEIYVLTLFNQVIAYSYQPSFSVVEEGNYSIVSIIQEKNSTVITDYISQPNISIFHLIEWVDAQAICASISNWDYTNVKTIHALSFNYLPDNRIRVNNIY